MPNANVITMPNANVITISDLNYCTVDAQPVAFDFGPDQCGAWEPIDLPCVTCSLCNFVGDSDSFEEGDVCPECESKNSLRDTPLERPSCTPLTNYYYPLPGYGRNPEVDQLLLHQWVPSVVLVLITDTTDGNDLYALALSGAGTEFSWDICLAHILLGYAPPIRFCSLPQIIGRDTSTPSLPKSLQRPQRPKSPSRPTGAKAL